MNKQVITWIIFKMITMLLQLTFFLHKLKWV